MRTTRPSLVRNVSTVLAATAIVLVALGDASAQTALRKAGRGLAAMTTGFLEVPGNMYRDGQEEGAGGVALGCAKGLGLLVPRTLVGVYELVTAPIPAPAGFRPILRPEFPWEYFEETKAWPHRRP
jgi:putative exosortase-associated protein (TIGR04073 family)